MNYLITGGAGFIGSNLAEKILNDKNNDVWIVDDLSMGTIDNLPNNSRIHFLEGSVTDQDTMEKLLSRENFDYIFHLAAVASVADSVARPVETHQVNFESVLLLLELSRKYQLDLKRLVFSSSAAVYGDEPTLPKKETSRIVPLTPYAVDKFAAERYVLNYCSLYNIPTSAVRFFNVFGPKQNPQSPYSGVISILVDRYAKKIKCKNSKVNFTMFGDGKQSRDFIFINDVLQALMLVAESELSLGKVYNVGNGIETNLNELVTIMNSILDTELPIIHSEARSGDIKHSLADVTCLKSLGFETRYTVEKGLREYLNMLF
ncbi:NAD-dependent epimerase/dehydratase family protein [Enterococcus faecium]|uniref:NAD-dependent epimerase/dehydratase family protein n=1 Tax=Enterococcus TaxID=1350 RepID=UPI002090C0E8|nr:NAD-dependent epimerase/dehydratase family protein [Enterococcus faecium]MCO5468967.1 NAD-dependent epimerase/dehydratase family protein [Enterococcus faecium]MDK4435100.1 NAD-dependent epimerase/dehydratase family protein [Enterococcus faecium]MDW7897285.1 NAD-dependent epimerase/dehydratase family protein [Enterococcus faecium]